MIVYLLLANLLPHECGKHIGVFSTLDNAKFYALDNNLNDWEVDMFVLDDPNSPELRS